MAKVLKGIDSKIIDMVTAKERPISITVEGLLGRPLNDVEKSFFLLICMSKAVYKYRDQDREYQ